MNGVDVLAVMDDAALSQPISTDRSDMREARDAVAELFRCADVTVRAFEALGRADNIGAQIATHRECERALIEQKFALARVKGESA